MRRALGGRSWIDYHPRWLEPEEAAGLHAALIEELTWERRPIWVFGREVLQPRLIAWGGRRPYPYSGQVLAPRPLGTTLEQLVERVQAATGLRFDHVLLNRYRDGADHMGMHADDEPELGEEPQIAALSLGAARRFALEPKPKKLRKRRLSIVLENGSLLVMGGRMQHAWRHGVPKQASAIEERINVTFRLIRYDPGAAPPRRRASAASPDAEK